MTSKTENRYIIAEDGSEVIWGIGTTEDDAWKDWAKVIAELDESTDRDDYGCHEAARDLLTRVEDYGGDISWNLVDGVACLLTS